MNSSPMLFLVLLALNCSETHPLDRRDDDRSDARERSIAPLEGATGAPFGELGANDASDGLTSDTASPKPGADDQSGAPSLPARAGPRPGKPSEEGEGVAGYLIDPNLVRFSADTLLDGVRIDLAKADLFRLTPSSSFGSCRLGFVSYAKLGSFKNEAILAFDRSIAPQETATHLRFSFPPEPGSATFLTCVESSDSLRAALIAPGTKHSGLLYLDPTYQDLLAAVSAPQPKVLITDFPTETKNGGFGQGIGARLSLTPQPAKSTDEVIVGQKTRWEHLRIANRGDADAVLLQVKIRNGDASRAGFSIPKDIPDRFSRTHCQEVIPPKTECSIYY